MREGGKASERLRRIQRGDGGFRGVVREFARLDSKFAGDVGKFERLGRECAGEDRKMAARVRRHAVISGEFLRTNGGRAADVGEFWWTDRECEAVRREHAGEDSKGVRSDSELTGAAGRFSGRDSRRFGLAGHFFAGRGKPPADGDDGSEMRMPLFPTAQRGGGVETKGSAGTFINRERLAGVLPARGPGVNSVF